ncbi:UNVERIFIED_CONTAM: hypothetical protein Scaly_0839500 [Sesamum calycinum]|uniref:Transposase n=1 Tax=Sesamum calycinum TaxID=2727403 RepID=A0AAW2RB65_9LAMI
MRRFMPEYYNWTSHGEDIVQDYYEAPSVPQVSEEPTSTGHVEDVPDDGTRSYPVDAGTSSYVYGGGGSYDYDESGLTDHFFNVVHAADQPLILPSDHTLSGDYYNTKKLVKDLTLPVDLEYCKFCGDEESRNVRLSFCTEGFVPHGQYGRTYSCWPVIITLYNLPPGMCKSSEYMFLTMVIPDLSNPKRLIDVYLQLLIEELLQLWHVGVRTNKKAFTKNRVENKVARLRLTGDRILDRVANISPAVEMSLLLPDGYGSDHKWTKKSIFWDLPYWSTLLIRHNLDVMHIEKNVFDIYTTRGTSAIQVDVPFERFLRELKKKVKNKEHVEASIVETYIVEKIGLFTSQHFEPDLQSKRSMPRRNDECMSSNDGFQVSIFNYPDRASGATKKRWLSGPERHIIETYILTKWEVVTPYYKSYLNELYQHHHPADPIIDRLVSTEFKDWLKRRGPSVEVTSFNAYFDNRYNFQTERHNTGKLTMNCGCHWVDPIQGMKVQPSYHLVDVNFKKLYQKDDPFILAQQAVQVYFTEYSSMKRKKVDWMAVCKIKARRVLDDSKWIETVAYQPKEVVPVLIVAVNNQSYDLRDPNGL